MSDGKKNPWLRVADGIYRDLRTNNLFERPTINGRPTWRKLDARVLKHARVELAKKRAEQAQASHGLAKDPYQPNDKQIGTILAAYESAGCPRRGLPREGSPLYQECKRIEQLNKWWKTMLTGSICQQSCDNYAAYRKRTVRKGSNGGRAIDLELSTLASAVTWAARRHSIGSNPFATFKRQIYADYSKRRRCRDVACQNADDLHLLAAHYFESTRSDVLGWQLLFEAYTGTRTSEILRCRMDAKEEREPGFVDGSHLWLNRSKGGVNPWSVIHPALKELLEAHKVWHKQRFPKSPWYFPNFKKPMQHAYERSLTKSLDLVAVIVTGQKITSHGMRSFYVTVRRSQGVSDGQIAAEIGDKTGADIIATTYGAIPPNWRGGKPLDWLPSKVPIAWAKWLPKVGNVIELPRSGVTKKHYEKTKAENIQP